MDNRYTLKNKSILIFLSLVLYLPGPAMAYNYSADVFKFQQKLAVIGDASAQYKLGIMYETGQGTDVDLNEALKWYEKSAAQDHKAALRRISYIHILSDGYKPALHEEWLKTLKKDAGNQDGEAMLLLGTMYKDGIAVKKNLQTAEKFFKQALIKNIPGAEDQLESIFVLKEEEKEKKYALKQKRLSKEKVARERKAKAQKEAVLREAALKQSQLEKQKKMLAQKQKGTAKERKNPAVQPKKKPAKIFVKKPEPVKKKAELSWAEAVAIEEKKEGE